LFALRMVVRAHCSTVVFSGVVNITVNKINACGSRNVLVVQQSIESPPARSASGVITRWWCPSVCLYVRLRRRVLIMSILICVCCDLLLPSTRSSSRDDNDVNFWGLCVIVHRQCRSTSLAIVYSALSATRVHSRQSRVHSRKTRVHCRQ